MFKGELMYKYRKVDFIDKVDVWVWRIEGLKRL